MHSLQVQPQTGEFRSSNWNRHLLWKATWRRTDSDQSKLFLVNLASESIALRVHQDDFVHNSGDTLGTLVVLFPKQLTPARFLKLQSVRPVKLARLTSLRVQWFSLAK